MPAESEAQRKATAIALHHPEILYQRNKGLLKMKREQLREFSGTREKNLPLHKLMKRRRKMATQIA